VWTTATALQSLARTRSHEPPPGPALPGPDRFHAAPQYARVAVDRGQSASIGPTATGACSLGPLDSAAGPSGRPAQAAEAARWSRQTRPHERVGARATNAQAGPSGPGLWAGPGSESGPSGRVRTGRRRSSGAYGPDGPQLGGL
jgi:hypothetical protein